MSNTITFFIQLIKTTPWQHLYALFLTGTVMMVIVFFTGYSVCGLSDDPVCQLILTVFRGRKVRLIMLPVYIVIGLFIVVFLQIVLLIGAIYVVDLNNKIMRWCKKKLNNNLQDRKD